MQEQTQIKKLFLVPFFNMLKQNSLDNLDHWESSKQISPQNLPKYHTYIYQNI